MNFYFKFHCCTTFILFNKVNHLWIDNRKNHKTFHDFMYVLNDNNISFDREELEKEYNTSISVIYFSEKWTDIHQTKTIFSNIKFVIVNDKLTTVEENKLKDLIIEVDDPLLDYIFPPNKFNDRCCITKCRSYKLTSSIDIPKIDKLFRYNVGKYFKIDENDFFIIPKSDENLSIVSDYYTRVNPDL